MGLLEKINSPQDVKAIPPDQLQPLADEIRKYIISVVSTNGGHIGSALGAVELAVALHRSFESPQDAIVWDVGHQAHAHKIITGRREAFKTFRQHGGLSGFLNKDESEHDFFTTGHAGASVSTALGLAAANRLNGRQDRKVVAVIGDAALVNGMSFEALNHAGHLKDDLIVVLNDNEMSISRTVGAMSRYLNKIISSPRYVHLRKDLEAILKKIPRVGERVAAKAKKLDESLKNLIVPGFFFEELGFHYLGPLDGHNIDDMLEILENIKKMKGPVLLHVVTKKGKGYKIAESDPARWHASTPFHVKTGQAKTSAQAISYTEVFGRALCQAAARDEKIVAITAAMCEGTGLVEFAEKYPDRFFDVGIAEEHAVSFAAGLARSGFKPVVAVYSVFLQRSYDQIFHDVALQRLPVIFCIDRAGIVGEDGPTHHGVMDIAYLRSIPGMTLVAPRDGKELERMIDFAFSYKDGPVAIRFPRGKITEEFSQVFENMPVSAVRPKKAEVLRSGKDTLILAYGSMVSRALEAAELLEEEGVSAAVINARFAKPLDEKTILDHARGKSLIVTAEEGALSGGFGSAVLEFLGSTEKRIASIPVRRLGVPDHFVPHGKRENLLVLLGLSSEGIRNEVMVALAQIKFSSRESLPGGFGGAVPKVLTRHAR